MAIWIIEQTEIFMRSKAPYILVITIVISFSLQFTANYHIKKFKEMPNNKPVERIGYKISAKKYHKASKYLLILGFIGAFGAYKRQKKIYDNW